MSNGPVNPFNQPAGPPIDTNVGGGGPTGNLLDQTYVFTVQTNPACWDGSAPTAFESVLQSPFTTPALEQLRALLLQYATTELNATQAARAVLQMAFETEISSVISDYVPITDEVKQSLVCPRRKYLDVDKDLNRTSFLYSASLNALQAAGVLPDEYLRLFGRHIGNNQPKYRVSALCALICYAAKMRDSGVDL